MSVMTPPLDLEIRSRLADYLGGRTSLQEFQGWFAPQAWNIEKRADPAIANLAREIELLLAEFANGDWTEEELSAKLHPFVTAYSFSIGEPVVTSSESPVMEFQAAPQTSVAGIQLVVEYV